MAPTSFHSLSAEILLEILRSLSSPADLYNLIAAARPCYNVFSAYKTTTLGAVVRNAVPEEILPDAVIACLASELRDIWWRECPIIRDLAPGKLYNIEALPDIRDFLEIYERKPVYLKKLTDPSILSRLCRLLSATEFFVKKYENQAFRRIEDILQPGDKSIEPYQGKIPTHTRLSVVERGRLQRAFFRVEIHRKLFNSRTKPTRTLCSENPHIDHRRFARRFIGAYPSGEREEIAYALNFLIEYSQKLIGKLDDGSVNTIVEDEAIHSSALVESAGGMIPTSSTQRRMLKFQTFLKEGDMNNLIRHAMFSVGFGLEYLKSLHRVDQGELLDLLGTYSNCPAEYSLCDALNESWRFSADEGELDEPLPSNRVVDSLGHCSSGWKTIKRLGLQRYQSRVRTHRDLRLIGYVFWDSERLQNLNLVERCPRIFRAGSSDSTSIREWEGPSHLTYA